MEIYKTSATSSPLHILSSSDLLVFTSSHLHIFSSSHHPILTSSPLHIFSYRIFTCSHPLIFTIFTTSHPHILSSSLIFKSSPLHIFTSSHLLSHLHIFTCSHLPLLPFCRLALLPSFLFLSWRRGAGAVPTRAQNSTLSHENEVRSPKTRANCDLHVFRRNVCKRVCV